MKKLISTLLVLAVMAAALAGCSNNAPNTPSQAPLNAETSQPQDTTAPQEESNIEKALSLINSFATGDTSVAASLLTEDYIQHNRAYGTGRDAFIASVEYLASAEVKTTVENIRAFEDAIMCFCIPSITLQARVSK